MHHQFFQKRRKMQRLSLLPIWSELFKIKNWTDMQHATFHATFSKQNFECFVFGFERADWLRIQCAGKKQCSVFYWYVKKIKQHSLRCTSLNSASSKTIREQSSVRSSLLCTFCIPVVLRLGDTRSFFRVGAMQHAPSHQHKKKSACPMVSIFVWWDKNRGKYPKDTLILSLGQWSKIDSNQFCSIVPGTKMREILSQVRK